MNARFIIRDREAGNIIAELNSYEESEQMLREYEEEDKVSGIYEDDFYEIVEIN